MNFPIQLFRAALALTFLPVSLATGFGYVSPVDLILALLFLLAGLKILKSGSLPNLDLRLLLLSFTAFILILIVQYRTGKLGDINILVKYFEFLVVIPLAVSAFRIDASSDKLRLYIVKSIVYAGSFLGVAVFVQFARGAYVSDGASYYIDFFGQYSHKNGLASILAYGVLAAAWCFIYTKRNKFVFLGLLQFLVIAFIGARSATLICLAFVPLLFMLAKGASAKKIFRTLILVVVGAFLLYVLALTGVFGEQLARFGELSNTSTDEVTASTSRLLLWGFAIQKIVASPWFGNGFGTFSYEGDGWLDGMYEPHNNVLQITYAGGFVMLALLVIIFVPAFRRLWKQTANRVFFFMLMSYLINTLFGIIWTRGDGHLFWMIFFCATLFPARSTRATFAASTRASFAASARAASNTRLPDVS